MIAELRVTRESLSKIMLLQWGRDQLLAELRRERVLHVVDSPASMGPRSIDRGTLLRDETGSFTPGLQWGRDQLIAELIRIGPCKTPPVVSLQWGRDQLIAELSSAPVDVPPIKSLQWGRDQLIAELVLKPSHQPSSASLQWGRDQLIAELTRARHPCSHPQCFNGAAIN